MKSIHTGIGVLGVALLLCAGLAVGPGCGGGGSGDGGSGGGGDTPQTGRAVLGPLAGATVRIYEMQPGATFQLLFTETTNGGTDLATAGTFDAHRAELQDGRLYLVKVTGGQDLDANDDGVLDASPTPNLGSIHAAGTGAQLKAGLFQVNLLTEIAYQQVLYLLMAGYPPGAVVNGMDRAATYLLVDDLNGDSEVTCEDLLLWDPALDQDALRKDYDHYVELREAILERRSQHVPENAAMLADITVAYERNIEPAIDVVVGGNYAYVSVHEDGIYVVDITDPRHAVVGPHLDTNEAEGLFLQGPLLYVADDDGLQIVDVSNPMSPFLRGKATLGGGDEMEWADDVVVSGNYAYLAEGEDGEIHVVDVSDPDAPTVVASHRTWRGSADGVALYGSYVLVADGDGLSVVDVSDPLDPTGIADVDTPGDADEVVVVGSLAYVASGGEEGLTVFDLTDPGNPQYLDSVPAPMDCEGIAVLGDYAYLAQREAGVQVIDVSDPENLESLGTCTVFGEGNGLCCHGDYVLVATEDEGGLRVLDISLPSGDLFTDALENPIVAELDMVDADDVVTDGRYAYAVHQHAVTAVDLLDPTKPVVLDQIDPEGNMEDEAARVAMQGNLLYIARGWAGLRVVDVTNPASLSLRGEYDDAEGSQYFSQDVCVLGDHVFTADVHGPHLLAINVTNPDAPAYAGENNLYSHGLRGVAPLGPDHVCVAWGFAGIRVLDVSDPTDPDVVGGDTLPHVDGDWHDADFVSVVGTNGNYAYVPGNEGAWIVDVSDPANVTTPGQIEGPEAVDFAFSGNQVYMACRVNGVMVADVTDPANPTLVTRVPLVGNARGIAVMGDYLLVANGDRFTVIRRPLVDSVP